MKKNNIKAKIPNGYARTTVQDILVVIAVSFTLLLSCLFLGGALFRTDWFESIFWNYLVPLWFFAIGFCVSGMIAKMYYNNLYKSILCQKESEYEELKQKYFDLQSKNRQLSEDLARQDQKVRASNFQDICKMNKG